MAKETGWLPILIQCRNNIQEQIAPLLTRLNRLQPDLGIGAGGDPIKRIDMVAENAIVNTLRKHDISFTLISEESGVKEYGENFDGCYVTADPIDGTTNLMRGVPFYATSIAISTEPTINQVHTALVADLFHGVTYTAQKGEGSRRNNKKITPSDNASLEEAVIGIDLNNYKIQRIVPRLNALIHRTKHIRHLGANALELCYVADGTTDAFIDIRGKLRATDIAAASLIVKESGAIMTTPDGKSVTVKLDPKEKAVCIAAGNHQMHKAILNLIKTEKEAE